MTPKPDLPMRDGLRRETDDYEIPYEPLDRWPGGAKSHAYADLLCATA